MSEPPAVLRWDGKEIELPVLRGTEGECAIDISGRPFPDGAEIATFDLNADVIKGIQDGKIAFAVDQQQYEQGYVPIVMLKLYHDNGNTLGGGAPVLTGPGFVDSSNVDKVSQYAARGTR